MIGRRRGTSAPELDLRSRAEAAARGLAHEPRTRGGLTGLLVRALRGRRARPQGGAPVEGADATEVRALREELTRELERVARAEPTTTASLPTTDVTTESS